MGLSYACSVIPVTSKGGQILFLAKSPLREVRQRKRQGRVGPLPPAPTAAGCHGGKRKSPYHLLVHRHRDTEKSQRKAAAFKNSLSLTVTVVPVSMSAKKKDRTAYSFMC